MHGRAVPSSAAAQEALVADNSDIEVRTAAGDISPRGIKLAVDSLPAAQPTEHPFQVVDDTF